MDSGELHSEELRTVVFFLLRLPTLVPAILFHYNIFLPDLVSFQSLLHAVAPRAGIRKASRRSSETSRTRALDEFESVPGRGLVG